MLNPPSLNGKLPAQYGNTLSFEIEHNRGVGEADYTRLKAKITTMSGASVSEAPLESTDQTASFELVSSMLKVGQYYKIQICYVDTKNIDGYYSTPGIFKYTAEPAVKVEVSDLLITGTFITDDASERVEQYKFDIVDENTGAFLETSGWLFHSVDTDNTNLGELMSVDAYNVKSLKTGEYKVYYHVITNNSLCVSATESLSLNYTFTPSESVTLTINNDEGYITVVSNFEGALLRSLDGETWETIIREFTDIFIDKTVEQGVQYYYAIGSGGAYNYNSALCDFEDIFLSDGKRQLKIRFNPKISSFKNTIQETKIDTIGGAYPVFFRNGRLKYKEFQLSGLISMLMDDNFMFIPKEDVAGRLTTPATGASETCWSTNLTGSNIANERKFKLEVLEWLNNGQPKLFRSATEGNYIVRLLNISLSPQETLGRMLHTFSATAYEMQECNSDNLKKMGFFGEGGE